MKQGIDFFKKLFDYSDWPPRWRCGRWSEFEGWLYIVSDLMIWAAYFTIPLVILRYISRKLDTRFTRLYFLFAAFILACGATHFLDAIAFWIPLYRVNALAKFITGIISWITVYYLFKNLPLAFSQRSVDELEAEIMHRKIAEEQVNNLNAELEQRVWAQTQEIIAAESKFSIVIENSSEAISLLNGSFDPVYSNNVAMQLTGRAVKEQNGYNWKELIHPDDKEKLKRVLADVQQNPGKSVNATFRIRHNNGYYVWLEGSFKNMLHDNVVNAIICNFRDITVRRKTEEQQYLCESIINSSSDAIISKTLDGIITSWNSGAEKIFGYTSNEAIGRHISMLIPPDRVDEEKNILNRISCGINVKHYETERIAKDGRLVYISLTVSPVMDGNGNITGASKIAKDITGERLTRDKLKKSEKIYHSIAANLPGSIVTIIDLNRNYILAEGEGIDNLGYTREGLEGKTEKEGLRPDAYELINPYREKAFGGEVVVKDFKLQQGYYLIRFIPLKDENGVVYAVMTISLDITEVKKAEEEIRALNETLERKVTERTAQLENANKEMEAFSYSVSHDLRAPLRIISGYADILYSEYGEKLDMEGNRLLGIIMNNTRQMGVLIDAMLNLSRLGRKEILIRNTNMNVLVRDVIEEQMIPTSGKVEIIIDDLCATECDSTLIRHVWSNFVSNAIKYSAKNELPVVTISSLKKDNEVVYSIKDNGVGFDMAYSHKLFVVFQRLHKKTDFEGTGVGLALIQRIVIKHGGKVWVEAEEGKGATFYFSLPFSKQ